jgi:hypothetical protein
MIYLYSAICDIHGQVKLQQVPPCLTTTISLSCLQAIYRDMKLVRMFSMMDLANILGDVYRANTVVAQPS